MVGIVRRMPPINVEAQGTAGTGQSRILGVVRRAGSISEVALTPVAAVAADATDYRIWTLFNRTTGAGTVVVATLTTATVAFVDNVTRLMTLTATLADRVVAVGDVLELVETVGGSGRAHGGYHAQATIDPAA